MILKTSRVSSMATIVNSRIFTVHKLWTSAESPSELKIIELNSPPFRSFAFILKFPQIVLFRLSTKSSLRWKSSCLRTGKSIIFLSSNLTARTVVVVINGCREVRRRIGCKSDGNTTNDKRAEMKGEEVGRKKSVIFYRIFFSFLCFSSHLRSPQYGEKQQESGIYAQTWQRVKNCCRERTAECWWVKLNKEETELRSIIVSRVVAAGTWDYMRRGGDAPDKYWIECARIMRAEHQNLSRIRFEFHSPVLLVFSFTFLSNILLPFPIIIRLWKFLHIFFFMNVSISEPEPTMQNGRKSSSPRTFFFLLSFFSFHTAANFSH